MYDFDKAPKREIVSHPCSITLLNLQLNTNKNIPNDECSTKVKFRLWWKAYKPKNSYSLIWDKNPFKNNGFNIVIFPNNNSPQGYKIMKFHRFSSSCFHNLKWEIQMFIKQTFILLDEIFSRLLGKSTTLRKKKLLGLERKRLLLSRDHPIVLGF